MSAAVPQKVTVTKTRVPEPDKPKSPEERAIVFLRGEAKVYGQKADAESMRAEKSRLAGLEDAAAHATKQAAYFGFIRDKILAGIAEPKVAAVAPASAPAPFDPNKMLQSRDKPQGR
jgi:hypothetical protein